MSHVIQWTATVVLCTATLSKAETAFRPEIPRIWDEEAFRDMELPLVVPKYSPKPVPADYYYKIPTRKIYKSYPVYAPGRGPENYLETLQTLEPQVIFDAAKLQTKQDWVRAGEQLVFEAPTAYEVPNTSARDVSDPAWYTYTAVRLTADGVLLYLRYVIREKDKVEVGSLGCMNCHLSVLQDGTVIKAGQGNFPMDRVSALAVRRFPLPVGRWIFLQLYTIPWIPERQKQFESYSAEEIVAILEAVPAGVLGRNRSSAHTPPAVPDLYGVRHRRCLDKSGLTRHKGIADLMRYAAMAEGIEGFSSFDGFIPREGQHFNQLPPPESLTRFSEEQRNAAATYFGARGAARVTPLRSTRATSSLQPSALTCRRSTGRITTFSPLWSEQIRGSRWKRCAGRVTTRYLR